MTSPQHLYEKVWGQDRRICSLILGVKWLTCILSKYKCCATLNPEPNFSLIFQSSVLSGATIDDDPEAECRRCCAFNFPVSVSVCNWLGRGWGCHDRGGSGRRGHFFLNFPIPPPPSHPIPFYNLFFLFPSFIPHIPLCPFPSHFFSSILFSLHPNTLTGPLI